MVHKLQSNNFSMKRKNSQQEIYCYSKTDSLQQIKYSFKNVLMEP